MSILFYILVILNIEAVFDSLILFETLLLIGL